MAHSSSSSSSSSSRRGENVLFLITHAMLHENIITLFPFPPLQEKRALPPNLPPKRERTLFLIQI